MKEHRTKLLMMILLGSLCVPLHAGKKNHGKKNAGKALRDTHEKTERAAIVQSVITSLIDASVQQALQRPVLAKIKNDLIELQWALKQIISAEQYANLKNDIAANKEQINQCCQRIAVTMQEFKGMVMHDQVGMKMHEIMVKQIDSLIAIAAVDYDVHGTLDVASAELRCKELVRLLSDNAHELRLLAGAELDSETREQRARAEQEQKEHDERVKAEQEAACKAQLEQEAQERAVQEAHDAARSEREHGKQSNKKAVRQAQKAAEDEKQRTEESARQKAAEEKLCKEKEMVAAKRAKSTVSSEDELVKCFSLQSLKLLLEESKRHIQIDSLEKLSESIAFIDTVITRTTLFDLDERNQLRRGDLVAVDLACKKLEKLHKKKIEASKKKSRHVLLLDKEIECGFVMLRLTIAGLIEHIGKQIAVRSCAILRAQCGEQETKQ